MSGMLGILCALAGCGGTPAPDISLTDQHGQPWTLAAQRGSTVALFFGYTHCADTCPTTLAKLAKALERVQGAKVAFVTVDPERDTPAVVGKYVARFAGAPIVGLTGTQSQITATESAYHVWAQKIPGKAGNDNYDDAHASYVFLIDRDGNQRAILHEEDTVQTIAEAAQSINQ